MITEMNEATANERACAYRVLRYAPNLVRDEWVNIGVLVFDPQNGERRLRRRIDYIACGSAHGVRLP